MKKVKKLESLKENINLFETPQYYKITGGVKILTYYDPGNGVAIYETVKGGTGGHGAYKSI